MDRINSPRFEAPGPLARAHERLSALEQKALSTGDESTLSVTACARAIEESVPDAPDARLKIVEEAMRAIEAGPASTVGMQAQVAKAILDKVDAAWPTLASRHDGARRAVEALAERAEVTHAPEARNARFLADIAHVVDSPEHQLHPMTQLQPADADNLAWYVSAARSGALGGVMTVGHRGEAARIVKMGLDEIRRNGGHPHLARMEAWQERVESPYTRLFIRYHTLEMIEDGVPPGPEAGLIVARKTGQWGKLPPGDKAILRQAAVDEALSPALPDGDLRRWLEFHQAARAIPDSEPMLDMVLNCLMWGAPPEPSYLDFAMYQVLRELPPEQQNREMVREAFDTLTPDAGWRETAERYLALANRCEKAAPDWETPMLERALQGARTAEDRSVQVLLEVFDQQPPAHGPERRQQLRRSLEQVLQAGHDPMQDALTAEPAPPGGITTTDDSVMIGSLRVPRRAVAQFCVPRPSSLEFR